MDAALGWVVLLLAWAFGGSRDSKTPANAPRSPRVGPAGGAPRALPSSTTTPWPQVLPDGLPPFPGAGWEYDEPPPKEVQQRAQQLVNPLWTEGNGASRTEKTGARWITYRAELVKGGTKGVVAYRVKAQSVKPPSTPPVRTATRPPSDPAPAPPAPAAVPSVVIPPPMAMPTPVSAPAPAPAPAAVPAAAPSVTVPSQQPQIVLPTLRRGAGIKPLPPDPNVKVLQQALGIADDGEFGAGTEAAVRAFQARHGLVVDGVVGTQTWTALVGAHA